jgi:hypothetical protein
LTSPDRLESFRAFAERRLTAEEFDAYVNAPMSPEEREGIRELYDWFTRRYPTPLERLAWVRRAIRRPLSGGTRGER